MAETYKLQGKLLLLANRRKASTVYVSCSVCNASASGSQADRLPRIFTESAYRINYNLDDTTIYSLCQEKIYILCFLGSSADVGTKYAYAYAAGIVIPRQVPVSLKSEIRPMGILRPLERLPFSRSVQPSQPKI